MTAPDFEDRSPFRGVREFTVDGRGYRFTRDVWDTEIWRAYEKRGGGGFAYQGTVQCESGDPSDLYSALRGDESEADHG